MPAAAGKFFMNKRMKHLRNVQNKQISKCRCRMFQMKIGNEKKKFNEDQRVTETITSRRLHNSRNKQEQVQKQASDK